MSTASEVESAVRFQFDFIRYKSFGMCAETVCSFANCGFVHTTKIMFTVTCPSQKIIFVVPLSVEFPKNMLFLFKIHFSIFCLHMMFRDY